MKAAQGRVPVFLDGGVRRGTDVFKALALGAAGIFVSMNMNFCEPRKFWTTLRVCQDE